MKKKCPQCGSEEVFVDRITKDKLNHFICKLCNHSWDVEKKWVKKRKKNGDE